MNDFFEDAGDYGRNGDETRAAAGRGTDTRIRLDPQRRLLKAADHLKFRLYASVQALRRGRPLKNTAGIRHQRGM